LPLAASAGATPVDIPGINGTLKRCTDRDAFQDGFSVGDTAVVTARSHHRDDATRTNRWTCSARRAPIHPLWTGASPPPAPGAGNPPRGSRRSVAQHASATERNPSASRQTCGAARCWASVTPAIQEPPCLPVRREPVAAGMVRMNPQTAQTSVCSVTLAKRRAAPTRIALRQGRTRGLVDLALIRRSKAEFCAGPSALSFTEGIA